MPLGLRTVMAGGLAFVGGDVAAEFYFGNWPGDWKQFYTREVLAHDPLVVEARWRTEPFTWNELRAGGGLTPDMLAALETTRKHGWDDGFAVPIHGAMGLTGLISFAGSTIDLQPVERGLLFALAHAAFSHGRMLYGALESKLAVPTPREAQIMRMVAEGQTDRVIAVELNISPTTVRFHVDHLRRRLDARNRAHAVAMLIAAGRL